MINVYVHIMSEPRGEDFRALLAAALPFATHLGLIMESGRPDEGNHALAVIERLRPFQVSEQATQSWPGTQIVGSIWETVHVYDFRAPMIDVIVEASSGLFDWINPDLPDDLHLLHADGSTLLGSTAQGRSAWLEVTPSQLDHMVTTAPWLSKHSTVEK